MAVRASATPPFLASLEEAAAATATGEPDWLAELRRAGIAIYRGRGLPDAKVEAWKYTSLNQLTKVAFAAAGDAAAVKAVPAVAPALAGARRLVFVNGGFRPDLSDPAEGVEGVEIASLGVVAAAAPEWLAGHLGRLQEFEGAPFAALNAALWRDGLVVRLAAGARLERPLHLISIGAAGETPAMFHARNLIVLDRGSAATLVESHLGLPGQPTFANGVTEAAVGEGAALRHYKLVDEAAHSFHIAAGSVRLDAGAAYEGFALTLGGRLVRNEVRVALTAPGGECRLNGAYLGDGDAHVDNTTLVDHRGAGATSRQVFKGVLDGTARGVFRGKVLVRKHAQKTDGHQLHKALLLSAGAEVDAKPELEIYADDVKCGHGATTGQLDPEMLFYLRQRGIPAAAARRLLIEAFVGEAVDEIADGAVREGFRAAVEGRLRAIAAGRASEASR